MVLDKKQKSLIYRNELFCLPESKIFGLPLSTKDFILLAEDGISLTCIWESAAKKIIRDSYNKYWIVHPM
jgi:hypothetical protein